MYKLAIVATGYIVDYDGVSVYIENVVRRLLEHPLVEEGRVQIDIFVTRSAKDLFWERVLGARERDGVDVIVIEAENALWRIAQTQFKLLSRSYDLLFMPNPMPVFVSRGRRLKVIHDLTIKQTPQLFSKSKHRYIDFLIGYMKYFDDAIGYISEQTKEDIRRFYGIDASHKTMLHLPNGIPFKVLHYDRPDMEASLRKYGGEEISFVVVGRVNRSKGYDRVLDFLHYFEKYLHAHDTFQKVTLHIVGKQTPETKALFADANFTKIEIVFHGYVDDEALNRLYKESHFCFFLSRNEGYGLPLVEAMWLRTIPLLSDIPIFSEIMGASYPKFGEKSGYTEAIVHFIERLYSDRTYLEEIFAMLEERVTHEKEGYRRCAENLLRYLQNRPSSEFAS